ncbi:flagellar basal body-associated FliL family protein [Gracilibacillus alcaliphilus]|uniref:flagellar basal body-associated protein FliL n=1 Tax=Gracilibacillus alcaliphilus TaxID=1401441 RepID=UPI00195A4418|nr:flagellar basal body-associated protein FliL [Gracilibacillus alcaliphilus]MBM7677942.1 flagellar FliL protein [Gracilibacillus alcaliphilus]
MSSKLIKILVSALLIIVGAGAGALYIVLSDEPEQTSSGMTLDEMVENSYTTEEIRTDLPDGKFVLIQFQFITDSTKGLEEIEKREFQIKNEFIKQSAELSAKDFKEDLSSLEENMKTAMNAHMEDGEIAEVLVINKVLQ